MIDTYKGVRDFYPEDQRVQNHIFSAMRRSVESFGYEEMNASILEPAELYVKKSSDEIVNEQTYTFTDRGNRQVTLRPEMTPTVARMVATRRRELGMPLRWYSIQNFFRYERPQRGRLREFWQLNADLFGASEPESDVEIVELAHAVMMALGAKESDFNIHVSNRIFLNDTAIRSGLEESAMSDLLRLIDKKEKMDNTSFKEALVALFGKASDADLFMESISASEHQPPPVIATLLKSLSRAGITNARFDPYIARGFDYYTGMVFEVFDTNPENKRALFGGGRYDSLIENYGGESTKAVGFAMGDVIARDFLVTHELLPAMSSSAQIYLAPITSLDIADTESLARTIRASGINIATGFSHKKVGDHVKAALKLGIPYFIAFGAKEKESGLLTVKTLSTEKEEQVTVGAVSEYLSAL